MRPKSNRRGPGSGGGPLRVLALVLAGTGVGLATVPAHGQSLAERIEAVRRGRAAEARNAQTRLLQALLYTEIDTEFDETPVRDVLAYLRTVMDVNLVARFSDDATGHGIDPATPITLRADELPALAVLELVLDQCSATEPATWQLRRSFIEVGTKERLSAEGARVTRVYPIDELLYEPPRYDDAPPIGLSTRWYSDGVAARRWGYRGYGRGYGAGYGPYGGVGPGWGGGAATGAISPGGYRTHRANRRSPSSVNSRDQRQQRANEIVEMIVQVVEPNAWVRNGGEWATIRYRDGSLVVMAPEYVHRQLGGYPPVPPPARPGE